MRYIYLLKNPIDQTVFYVGCTSNVKNRYRQHLKNAVEHQNTPKNKLIFSLLQRSMQPLVEVVEQHEDPAFAREREEFYVKVHLKTALNIHMPGKGSKDVKFYKAKLQNNGR
jgi:predicted GIY-YIG superfamily endonuclease